MTIQLHNVSPFMGLFLPIDLTNNPVDGFITILCNQLHNLRCIFKAIDSFISVLRAVR